ncbi:BTAD domain-containing putative transcriptional regulator [Actinoallomurus sp. CA-150999]|uniref:AfsR/SARP family transcriptional regulator n=1 Tax=Actinoallomurus sp. CA-150999 TaxID=3239887 RepID=UPI003D8E1E06
MAESVEFRILGPLEVRVDERVVDLPPKLRALLVTLLCRANSVISADQLIDALWGGDPPRTAAKTLQGYVHHLRRALRDEGRIAHRPPGYLLAVRHGELDVVRFEELFEQGTRAVAEGRFTEGADLLRQAGEQWRGPMLEDQDEITLIHEETVRLTELRQVATEKRIEAELAMGRHAELIGELSALVAEYPFRERLRAHLMLALHRCGRSAEALELSHDGRELLKRELGVDPGVDLRRIEEAILAGDPELDVPRMPSGPAQLPRDIADFTGHEAHVEELTRVLADGGPAIVISAIAGLGGIGKTTLAVHVASQLIEEFPHGQLYVDLGGAEMPLEATWVLNRFLRDLGVDGSSIPETLDERATMYRSVLATRRILVVLDNAHDEAQVRALLPGSPTCAVLLTSRRRLSGLESVHRVDLDVFEPRQAVRLLAQIAGTELVEAEPDAAAEIVELCGRLPLAVRIAGSRLASRPDWRLSDLAERLRDQRRRLDELATGDLAVRTCLALSYTGLSSGARRLFRLLGLLETPDFAAWVAVDLLDTTPAQADRHLGELLDARIIGSTAAGRYRFHDLIRLYARELADREDREEDRRAALTRAFGAWLALAEQAHITVWEGDYAVVHGSAPRRRLPEGTDAETEPFAWYRSERAALLAVVRQSACLDMAELCWDLVGTLVCLFEALSHHDEWRVTVEYGLAVTRRMADRRGQATMLTASGLLGIARHRHERAEAELTEAMRLFTEVADPHGRALALTALAYVRHLGGRYDIALAGYEEALDALRGVGDRGVEVIVLRCIGQVHIDLRHPHLAEPYLVAARAVAGGEPMEHVHPQLIHLIGELDLERGEVERAERSFDRLAEVAREHHDPRSEAFALYGLGNVRQRQGALNEAEELLQEALSIARDTAERLLEARTLLTLGECHHEHGHRPEALGALTEAVAIFEEIGTPLWQARALESLASHLEAVGETDAARENREWSLRLYEELRSPENDHGPDGPGPEF